MVRPPPARLISVASGGAPGQAAIVQSNGHYQGAAYASGTINIDPFSTFYVMNTLTLLADPASIETIDLTPDLFNQLDLAGNLPDFNVGSTTASTPEPSTFLLLGGGLFAAGWFRRRRA